MQLEGALKYPLVFLAALACTLLLVPFTIRLCRWSGLMDLPSNRRIHRTPTPRGGGLAVFVGLQFGCALTFLFPWSISFSGSLTINWWQQFTLVSAGVVVLGLMDDAYDLRWSVKLAAQTLFAVLLFALGHSAGHVLGHPLPLWLDLSFTVLWILGFTNAFNLIDGMDGLAAGLGGIAALGLAGAALLRVDPSVALVLLALAGACIGFLRFNFHPAKIFLGDAGSMLIGFTLAAISLSSVTKTSALTAIGVPFLAVGIPVFDTMLAIWRRSVRSLAQQKMQRFKLMQADMDHLHHRLLRLGLSQAKVALMLYGLNVCMVAVGLLSVVYHQAAVGIFIIAFVLWAYVALRHLARVELIDSGSLIVRGLALPRGQAVHAVLGPVGDAAVLVAGLSIATLVTGDFQSLSDFRRALVPHIPLWCGLPFIIMMVSGTYRHVWKSARSTEFLLLFLTVTSGIVLAVGCEVLQAPGNLQSILTLGLVQGAFSCVAILGARALPSAASEALRTIASPEGPGVLIYGAGPRGLLYLLSQELHAIPVCKERIMGFIDDEPLLRKKKVRGYQVLGNLKDLEGIVDSIPIRRIIVAAPLSTERRSRLVDLVEKSSIELEEFNVSSSELQRLKKPRVAVRI